MLACPLSLQQLQSLRIWAHAMSERTGGWMELVVSKRHGMYQIVEGDVIHMTWYLHAPRSEHQKFYIFSKHSFLFKIDDVKNNLKFCSFKTVFYLDKEEMCIVENPFQSGCFCSKDLRASNMENPQNESTVSYIKEPTQVGREKSVE